MKLTQYQVDAFTSQLFSGNPAAVVPLSSWLDTSLMQHIAAENNLSETAFFVPTGSGFHIRWFTPECEVDLCGHATLAAAYVLFHCLAYQQQSICFESLSGPLYVSQHQRRLTLDFPSQPSQPIDLDTKEQQAFKQTLTQALNQQPQACLLGEDLLVVLESEQALSELNPDLSLLAQLQGRGVIVTAPSESYDFVSRFFAPAQGLDEDPVTGSAHTQLTPYWATRLGKQYLHAKQVSIRGGELFCELQDQRVLISGDAVLFMTAEIHLPESNRKK